MKAATRERKAREAMRALAKHGNADRAAVELNIHPETVRRRVRWYCALKGFDSVIQAAYWLDPAEDMSSFPTKAA